MHDSIGWVLFLAGLVGSILSAKAKRFHRAELVDTDVVINTEDLTPQGVISARQRIVLVVICISLALIGAYLIQRAHNWNPFT